MAAEVLDGYEQAIAIGRAADARAAALAVRYGLAPADLLPRAPGRAAAEPAAAPVRAASPRRPRRAARAAPRRRSRCRCAGGVALAVLALQRIGVDRVAASLVASQPGLVAAGLGADVRRDVRPRDRLARDPRGGATWRRAKRRDAMQGTFIGVLMSATLPARLGEPSRALIVARRLGRARETLPVVLGTMVSQTLLNLLALALLGVVDVLERQLFDGHHGALCWPRSRRWRRCARCCSRPRSCPRAAVSRAARADALRHACGVAARLRDGLRAVRARRARRRSRPSLQLGAWGLQWLSAAGCC